MAENDYWPAEMWPTKNGGHTYLGFMEIKQPRFWGVIKGTLKPVPIDNWSLLTDEIKTELREAAMTRGLRIVADD